MSPWRDDDLHCNKCLEIVIAEGNEVEIGIGTKQSCYPNEDYCRHCLRKWPITDTVYNAVYGGHENV